MKLAILGLGYWGPNLLRVFNNLDVVAHAFDLDQRKLDKFSANPAYKHINFGLDYTEALVNPEIDAIVNRVLDKMSNELNAKLRG